MYRKDQTRSFTAAVYCLGIAVVVSWLIAATLVYALVLKGANNDLNNAINTHNSKEERITTEVTNLTTEAGDAIDELEQYASCLNQLCETSVLTRLVGAYRCLGCWDANTNTPMLSSSNCTQGDVYVVCVAGSTNLNNFTDWAVKNLVVCVDTEMRWARVGSLQVDLTDNGTHVSLITDGVGNALTMATAIGENGVNVSRTGSTMFIDATVTTVSSTVRVYSTLNGTTQVLNSTNSLALNDTALNLTAPVVVREYWTRSGSILEGFVTVAFKPNITGESSVTLGSWPQEIVAEFGGLGNTSTVLRNTVACTMVLSNADESIPEVVNVSDGTIVDISNDLYANGCFVNPPPSAPGLAQDTTVQLFVEYLDIPNSTMFEEAYNQQLWHLTFLSVAPF